MREKAELRVREMGIQMSTGREGENGGQNRLWVSGRPTVAFGPLPFGFSTQPVDQVCWVTKTMGKLRTPEERGKHQSEVLESSLPAVDWL